MFVQFAFAPTHCIALLRTVSTVLTVRNWHLVTYEISWLATTTQFVRSFENPVPGPQPIYATLTFYILSVYFSPISDSQPHAVGRALYHQAVSLTLLNTYNSFLALSPSPHITASAQLSSSSTFVRASSSISGPFLHCYLHALAPTPVLLLEQQHMLGNGDYKRSDNKRIDSKKFPTIYVVTISNSTRVTIKK